MRTTVEIPDELRAKLLSIAAERGEKGYSKIVEEALIRHLDEIEHRRERGRAAAKLLGRLDDDEATAIEESVKGLRERWR